MRWPVGRNDHRPLSFHSSKGTFQLLKLFTPTQVGPYKLSHRVVMAPLTRMRSDPGDIPSDRMVEYYTQRASNGGMIISAATPVSIRGYGYAGTPGVYSDTQIAGWQRVTDAVHSKGGRIFQQLWHVGRQSHVDLQPNGDAPVAPSAIAAEGYAYTKRGEAPFSMPRALKLDEIFQQSSRSSGRAPSGRCGRASMVSRFTVRTAICPISFSKTAPTSARMNTAARSKAARASCWRSLKPRSPSGEPIGSACA
jgi:hypothetical protein